MKCIKPFTRHGQAYGCGQCLPCRVSKRRIWRTRIIIEAANYSNNQFVTLTYSDGNVPLTSSAGSRTILPTLVPRDLQLFLKRLRHHSPQKLRFFGVGEYGNETFRPHYHVGLFNFQPCSRGKTIESRTGRRLWFECCPTCRLVGTVWGKGDIEVRDLDAGKSGYLAGYVTKKMTSKEDARLLGRHPEFPRQSRRPGVGAVGVPAMAKLIEQFLNPEELVDVPMVAMIGDKPLPLGRYMRNKLRLALGLPEGAPDEVLRQAWSEQVLPLLKMAQTDEEAPTLRAQFFKANKTYADTLDFRRRNFEKGKL